MKKSRTAPPLESPIPFRPCSNGEFVPRAETARDRQASELFRRVVEDGSRRLGISRRAFIESACGTAAALLVINHLSGCGGSDSGGYTVDAASTVDGAKACEELSGDQFILDVQTHHVNPEGSWRQTSSPWEFVLGTFPQASCGDGTVECFDTNHYIRELFVNSETSMAVLSAVPATPEENPLLVDEEAQTRQLVQMLSGSQRLLIHGLVLPDRGSAELDGMQGLAEELAIDAWKVYTQFGGWSLTDADGLAFIERARSLGIKTICAHKGLTLPLPGFDGNYSSSADLVAAAQMFPDVRFVVYHSNYETNITEGPYDPNNPQGVDVLIEAMESAGKPTNVYAEIGSTWRNVMTDAVQASHVLGKLLGTFGEDRILWGTDSIWYGSPQAQIDAFRSFQIASQLQGEYGTISDTAKAKIFGLNAAALYGVDPAATLCEIAGDALAARRAELPDRPAPRLRNLGPRTRRELFAFLRARGGAPG